MSFLNTKNLGAKVAWAQSVLIEHGYASRPQPRMLRRAPWSTVWCFATDRGEVYLKATPPQFAYEADLLTFLKEQSFEQLPVVLAVHPDYKCFLMQDAGEVLQRSLQVNYDIALVRRLLKSYAQLQLQCIPLVDRLLQLGLRDLGPRSLPAAFKVLLATSDLGFSAQDTKHICSSQTMLSDICEELDAIGIPATLEHGDFDDDNILIKGNTITFADFGDATIAHPFLSLTTFLNSAQSVHALKPSSKDYVAIRDAYLEEWQHYASHEQLVRGLELANKLLTFVWMFGLKRIQSCPDIEAAEYAIYVDKVIQHYKATS